MMRFIDSVRALVRAAGLILAVMLLSGCLYPVQVRAEDAVPAEADKAWQEALKAARPPAPPAEWATKSPNQEAVQKFREQQQGLAMESVKKFHDFYTRYPNHPNAEEAKTREQKMIRIAAQLGNEEAVRLAEAAKPTAEPGKTPETADDLQLQARWRALNEAAKSKEAEGMAAMTQVFEKGLQQLIKDFPKHTELYNFLVMVADNSSGEHARELLKQVVDSPAPEEIKAQAQAQLNKLAMLGKPVELKYTDLNGHPVDIAALKGKVVLIDFWATWCGPCVAEMPHVRAAYEKYHDKGFEVLGISLDSDKDALAGFLAREKIPWAQHFDGEGWQGAIVRRFGVNSIPAMLLVDKKGLLRDLSARGDLEGKIEKMLAEAAEKDK